MSINLLNLSRFRGQWTCCTGLALAAMIATGCQNEASTATLSSVELQESNLSPAAQQMTGTIELLGSDFKTKIAAFNFNGNSKTSFLDDSSGSSVADLSKLNAQPSGNFIFSVPSSSPISELKMTLRFSNLANVAADSTIRTAVITSTLILGNSANGGNLSPSPSEGSVSLNSNTPQTTELVANCNNLISGSYSTGSNQNTNSSSDSAATSTGSSPASNSGENNGTLIIRLSGLQNLTSCIANAGVQLNKFDPTQIGNRDITEGLAVTSEADDQKNGSAFAQNILAHYGEEIISENAPASRYLQRIMNRIVKASDRPDLNVHVHLVNSMLLQAFALPDGSVFVYRGLLAESDSEAELAGVLGHEWAHVTARHMSRKQPFSRFLLSQKSLALQRSYESDADAIGTQYAWNAGFEPGAITSFFKMVVDLENDQGIVDTDANSDHPALSTRIDHAESLTQLYYPTKDHYVHTSIDFVQAQNSLKELPAASTDLKLSDLQKI